MIVDRQTHTERQRDRETDTHTHTLITMLGAKQLLMKCGQMASKSTALTSSRLLFLLAAMHRPPDARHYNTDKHHNIKISQYKI